MTVFDLLLQIIEVHFDLGLEVPAARPKSRLSLKRSRPCPPPPLVEVTPTASAHQPESAGHQEGPQVKLGPEGAEPKKNHARTLKRAKFLPAMDGVDRCEYYFQGIFFLAPVFCPHATHSVNMTLFLAGLHWPLGKSSTATAPCDLHPPATTARPQPTHPEPVCIEGLPEVSITF